LVIRKTWANFPRNGEDWILRFFLGKCPTASHENAKEHHTNDLVMTTIEESYHSIPTKTAAMISYAKRVKATWLFKTDDDAFANVPELQKEFAKWPQSGAPYVGWWHVLFEESFANGACFVSRALFSQLDRTFSQCSAGH
jgi:hypothetical protein